MCDPDCREMDEKTNQQLDKRGTNGPFVEQDFGAIVSKADSHPMACLLKESSSAVRWPINSSRHRRKPKGRGPSKCSASMRRNVFDVFEDTCGVV